MTLAQITRETRLLIKFSAILGTIAFILLIFFEGGVFIKKVFFPTPPAPPEVKYGKLPNLGFTSSNPQLQYRVNTIDGNLPYFPDRVRVYKIIQPEIDINALSTVRTKVGNLNFTDGEQRVPNSETEYQWTNTTLGEDIQYDTLTNNFTIKSSILSNPNLVSTITILPDQGTIVSSIQNLLTGLQEDTSDIDTQNTSVTYYKLVGQQLEPLQDNTEAQVAKVNFNQLSVAIQPFQLSQNSDPVTNLPIIYSKPDESNISFTVAQMTSQVQIISGQYLHYAVNKDDHSTYPLKTSAQAFSDLQKGNAVVFYTGTDSTIDVTDVSLAYYLGPDLQEYLQPVYVFKGKNLTAYVQAISSSAIAE